MVFTHLGPEWSETLSDKQTGQMTLQNTTSFRVRYEETDRMESVYHSNYLVYFEIGRNEFMREAGVCYREMEEEGFGLVVVEAQANFRKPAFYDDIVTVQTALPAFNPVSIQFDYSIFLGEGADGPLLCDGHTVMAFLDSGRRPRRIPEKYLAPIRRSSAGRKLVRNR